MVCSLVFFDCITTECKVKGVSRAKTAYIDIDWIYIQYGTEQNT